MDIYFSCSLTGGRKDEAVYAAMVDYLLSKGHAVPTAHLAHADVMALEQVVDAHEVYRRDIAWIHRCDALIAEVSTPSHGVGYEVSYALSLGKPVLCCYRKGARVSKMLLGNDSNGISVRAYEDTPSALRLLESFLQGMWAR